MLVSYKWLKEYVDIDVPADELAEKMSRTGIEVEDVSVPADGLKKIVVGHVLECVPHPDSDHLSICQVNVGAEEPSQIVCGAPNIAAGQKVIVALPGARITDNVKIKKGKMRGEASFGMICSLQELGYSDNLVPKEYSEGIYVLPETAVAGESVFPYLWMDDDIIELSITPNRADALSMRGVAYEVASIYRKSPNFPAVVVKENPNDSIEKYIKVAVETPEQVKSYNMRVIKNVKIGPSPLWLQRKLMNEGIRPINNVVDATNYILLEYGQPLHAFDYDKLTTKAIVVRYGKVGESLVTLDGVTRELTPENIVITDGKEPIALGGVMGGLDSEITAETTTVALEAAVFDAVAIRKTARHFGLRSESSSRYEKGINLSTITDAQDAACALIIELAGGEAVSGIASVDHLAVEPVLVEITLGKINRTLGTNLTVAEVTEIFDALGFTSDYHSDNDKYTVSIPPRRWDIHIEADIIEEVARIYGYDALPATLPTSASIPGILTESQQLVRNIKHYLEGCGLSEIISYSLTTEAKAARFAFKESGFTRLDWPMSEEHSVLRMSVLNGVLDTLAYNTARKNQNLAIYEIGKVFYQQSDKKEALPQEELHLALALTGLWTKADWQDDALPVDFYLLKGLVERLLDLCHLSGNITFEPTQAYSELHPGRTAVVLLDDQIIGFVGQLHPAMAQDYGVGETYVCELNLATILSTEKVVNDFQPAAKYPATSRDIALLVAEKVTHQQLVECIKANGGKYLQSVHLFDLYDGVKIEHGKKSLAYKLTFQNREATLTDEQITKVMEKVTSALAEEYQVIVR